ncbi:MBL fold metallo-hydrolase [Lignipirellula cremea]|uniref:Beta-lactamase superfamily domain protein n=1 Tax=Lignipirellula cremea TaxID=2528010 RepID=A0A518DZK7_9BACT|nr:hypothetical protein [Lignipirellula cremea]QDU97280.1 Beta-lactamase superfamily domain protein [Lignipirellula cremea]
MYDADAPWTVRRSSFRRELYGSRTTCFFYRHHDTFIVIDHGLGVETVSDYILAMLAGESDRTHVIHCIQTHYHEDHLAGLRASSLLFAKNLVLRFYSPELSAYREEDGDGCDDTVMEQVLEATFQERFWPVTLPMLDSIGARREHLSYRPGETIKIGDVRVHTIPLSHPGGCSGLRLETSGSGAIVIATDYEPPEKPEAEVVEFFSRSKLLIADMQYRDEEYTGERSIGGVAMSRVGWGHGTPDRILPAILACSQRPERVLISHHDPKRSDMELRMYFEESLDRLESLSGRVPFAYEFAHDGDVFGV